MPHRINHAQRRGATQTIRLHGFWQMAQPRFINSNGKQKFAFKSKRLERNGRNCSIMFKHRVQPKYRNIFRRKRFTKRIPVWVISATTPFNHPLNMVSHKVVPAITTNNCVVFKPSELTAKLRWLASCMMQGYLQKSSKSAQDGQRYWR